MANLTGEQAKEIAENLDCGFNCYLHKATNEFLFVPNPNRFPNIDEEAFSEEFEKIENSPHDYLVIEPPESRESFEIMTGFVEEVNDAHLQNKLIHALEKRHPFREFNYLIHNSGNYREKWFDFKNQKLKEWVTDVIDRANALKKYLDEEESE